MQLLNIIFLDDSCLCLIAAEKNISRQLWLSLEDSESYVRAAAITGLDSMLAVSNIYKHFNKQYNEVSYSSTYLGKFKLILQEKNV